MEVDTVHSEGGHKVRVVNIYATPWRFVGALRPDEGRPEGYLGAVRDYYDLYREQLPRLLPGRVLGGVPDLRVALFRPAAEITVLDGRAELFALPSNQVVLAVTVNLTDVGLADGAQAGALADVLDLCIEGELRIGNLNIWDALHALLPATNTDDFEVDTGESRRPALPPERHQLVFVTGPAEASVPTEEVIDKVLYRSEPRYRPEFVEPKHPRQLNSHLEPVSADQDSRGQVPPHRRARSGTGEILAVVTPYVSLLYGQQSYVEESIFFSTVHAVGTAARFRHIWRDAYQRVLEFRRDKWKSVGRQTRDDLETLADSLGDLEFDLTFSVEFPLMRIETFRSELYEAMDLQSQARTLSQMFDQLGGSLRSEITAIEVRETRTRQRRHTWNSFAAGLLSFVGIPVGLVVAFLGINTTEVPDPKVSMWDPPFVTLYLIASALALIPTYFIVVPYLREGVGKQRWRGLWWGVPAAVVGAAIALWARLVAAPHTDLQRILVAFATSFGVVLALTGVTLVAIWGWEQSAPARTRRRAVRTTRRAAAARS